MVQQENNSDSEMLASTPCSSSRQLQEEAREVRRRRKKKRSGSTLVASHFLDLYKLTGEVLGRGSCGSVQVCRSIYTSEEYAVKIIEKEPELCRSKVFKEIEMMHHCQGHNTIIQMVEYFEEDDKFYLVFEKMNGGTLLSRLHKNFRLTETEASMIMRDLASALDYLHQKGIAHRDVKLENILCVYPDSVYPVKICDFDLASDSEAAGSDSATTPDLYTPVGTAEYMAPEVVSGYLSFDNDPYDKRCDLWSLGICLYFMLCGYHPFTGDCGDENCEWDLGGDCQACQELLFDNISNCTFDFPEDEWSEISDDAKNLISQLLIEEPYKRLPASMILENPWVVSGGLPSQDSPVSPLEVTQDSSSITNCDMPSEVVLDRSRPIVRTASRDDNWRERSPDDLQFELDISSEENWRDQSPNENHFELDISRNDNWRDRSPDNIRVDVPMDDNWRDRSPAEVQFDVVKSQADACNNWRENSHVIHWETPRKSQGRSSRENWRKSNHSERESWRRTPKINMNDRRTHRLLNYFDTRMKMYELMKEKFNIGSSDSEYLYDLCMSEQFRLSPPSSRLAQRRHGRGGIRNKDPYQQTHLIAAF